MSDHEAFMQGYDAYWEGRDRDANPHDAEKEPEQRAAWEQGWCEARRHDYDESDG